MLEDIFHFISKLDAAVYLRSLRTFTGAHNFVLHTLSKQFFLVALRLGLVALRLPFEQEVPDQAPDVLVTRYKLPDHQHVRCLITYPKM